MSSDGKAADVFAGAWDRASIVVSGLLVGLEAAAGGRSDRHRTFDGLLLKNKHILVPARVYTFEA